MRVLFGVVLGIMLSVQVVAADRQTFHGYCQYNAWELFSKAHYTELSFYENKVIKTIHAITRYPQYTVITLQNIRLKPSYKLLGTVSKKLSNPSVFSGDLLAKPMSIEAFHGNFFMIKVLTALLASEHPKGPSSIKSPTDIDYPKYPSPSEQVNKRQLDDRRNQLVIKHHSLHSEPVGPVYSLHGTIKPMGKRIYQVILKSVNSHMSHTEIKLTLDYHPVKASKDDKAPHKDSIAKYFLDIAC